MSEKENFELNKHCLPLQVFRYQEKTCRHRDDVMRCTERVGHHKTFVACRYHGEYPAKINKSCKYRNYYFKIYNCLQQNLLARFIASN